MRPLIPLLLCLLLPLAASAQTVKGTPNPLAPDPPMTYHGLLPGLSTLAEVKAKLGEPVKATRWYNYKLYYPAAGREGLFDVVHMRGDGPDDVIGDIESASIPEGLPSAGAVRAALGEPEYELRMKTWQLLDYSELGLRFTFDAAGVTNGVVYVPHTFRRVPLGERSLVDLTHLRQGVQAKPHGVADLGGLKAGAAEAVITPAGADWLGRPFTVFNDLKARIAVFDREDLTVALIGADNFGMNGADLQIIRDDARELGVEHVVFGASHNHAAGDTLGVYGHYPAEYIAHIQQRTLAGIQEALGNLQEVGEFRAASKELPMDGARVQGLFRNARNPGVLDPTISMLQALDTTGKPIATVVNFACHVESLEKEGEIGADFPGYMCDQITADGGGQAVFLNGAVGGMVSGDNEARTQESAREMGLQLAAIVGGLAAESQPPATFSFYADRRSLELPVTNAAFKAMLSQGKRTINRGRLVTDMTFIALGEAWLVTVPGEVLPEVSYEILEGMKGFPRMIVGLANDQLGYIIPPYDFRDDYYEETVSIGPATAYQVRDMALRMFQGR